MINFENLSLQIAVPKVYSDSFGREIIESTIGGKFANHNKQTSINILNNINLNIRDGDRVGLLGHNGAGKTSLLKIIAGIIEPTSGSVQVNGKVVSLLNSNSGINMDYSGYDNIYMRLYLMGKKKNEIDGVIKKIIDFSELGEFIHMPIKTYSSGMYTRLIFSINTFFNAEILLMDEFIGLADKNFIKKGEKKINEIIKNSNNLVLATHSKELIKRFCNRVIILSAGTNVFYGATKVGLEIY
jgi:lipopolysaccharide transport system ATP-binding protein